MFIFYQNSEQYFTFSQVMYLLCNFLYLFIIVTYLPGDRLSRVTRRGMLSKTKSQTEHPAASRSEGQRAGYQKLGLNSTFSRGADSEGWTAREKTQVKEAERVNRSETNRLQSLEEFDLVRITFLTYTLNPISVNGKKLSLPNEGIFGASFRILVVPLWFTISATNTKQIVLVFL